MPQKEQQLASAQSTLPLQTVGLRCITKSDYDHIISVLDAWWGGPAREVASPFFLYEFGEHSFVAVETIDGEEQIIGFLLGFMAQTTEVITGYVHLVGIHPDHRRRGIGKMLYEHFTAHTRKHRGTQIKAISSIANEHSIAFHRALGFETWERENYAGPKRGRMVYLKRLAQAG